MSIIRSKKFTVVMVVLAVVIGLMMMSGTSHAATKKLKAPKKVKISKKYSKKRHGLVDTITWKKVKGAKGYRIKVGYKSHHGHNVCDTLYTKKCKRKYIGAGSCDYYYPCSYKVQAYKIVKGKNGKYKKVYGKWSKWKDSKVTKKARKDFRKFKGFRLVVYGVDVQEECDCC